MFKTYVTDDCSLGKSLSVSSFVIFGRRGRFLSLSSTFYFLLLFLKTRCRLFLLSMCGRTAGFFPKNTSPRVLDATSDLRLSPEARDGGYFLA